MADSETNFQQRISGSYGVTNPYAPPGAVVADIAAERPPKPTRRLLTRVVTAFSTSAGVISLFFAVLSGIGLGLSGKPFTFSILLAVYGLLSIGAAMGIRRGVRLVAILWVTFCALLLVIPLVGARNPGNPEIVVISVMVLQLIGALLGVFAIVTNPNTE